MALDMTPAANLGRPVDLSDVISKFVDIILGGAKIVVWISAAVVYGWLLLINITNAQLFEKAFCIGVMTFGTVLGYLNIKKFPKLVTIYKDYRETRREQLKAKRAAGEEPKEPKHGDWPGLDDK